MGWGVRFRVSRLNNRNALTKFNSTLQYKIENSFAFILSMEKGEGSPIQQENESFPLGHSCLSV